MGKKNRNRYRNPNNIMAQRSNYWFTHYYQYLTLLAYQLFEWKGLPESIDPRYLEMSLHETGYVGFYKDKERGFIASQGSLQGVNHYLTALKFMANSPVYQHTFDIYSYNDLDKDDKGVVIYNNDLHFSTLPSLKMFATDLAEHKEVIYVNINAQKTPYVITGEDMTRLSILQFYNQAIEGNSPFIIADKSLDVANNVQVLNTNAPYVADKINQQKNAVWNEVMTYLGIKNANLEKKERMITAEADSNDEQIQASGNVFLKSRQEACTLINDLYGLNVSVDFRQEIVEEIEGQIEEGEEE